MHKGSLLFAEWLTLYIALLWFSLEANTGIFPVEYDNMFLFFFKLSLCPGTQGGWVNILLPARSAWTSPVISAGVHVCSSAHINSLDPETGLSHRASVETSDPPQGHFWLVSLRLEWVTWRWVCLAGRERHWRDTMWIRECEVILISANPGVLVRALSKGQ